MADHQTETTYQVSPMTLKRPLESDNLEAPKSPLTSGASEDSDGKAINLSPPRRKKLRRQECGHPKPTALQSTPFPHQAPGKDWSLVTKDGPLLIKDSVIGRNKTKKTMKKFKRQNLKEFKNRNPYSFKYIFKCKDFKPPAKKPLVSINQILPSKFNLVAQEVIKKGEYIMNLDFKLTTKAKLNTNSLQISQDPPLVVQFCDEPDKKGSHLGAFLRDDLRTRNTDLLCLITENNKYPTILLLARKDIQTFEPLTVDFNSLRTAHSN